MSDGPVLTEVRDGWRLITLNRPEKLNAFNEAVHAGLRRALAGAEADPACRCVVLTGAGRAFSAGQDLGDRVMGEADGPPDLSVTLETHYNPLIRAIRRLPMPVIAAVNGVAAGAAANIVFACDITIAAKSAKFLEPFASLGLVPDAGGTWTLPRLVGNARAWGMAMLAEPVPAESAEAWGLIWKAVDDGEFTATVEQLAARLTKAPTDGLARMKRAFDASWANTLDQQLDLERDVQREAGRSPDYTEGVTAFLQKRPPRFRGRFG